MKTADRLFYAHGIHATGVDAIAEAANVSKASMYTYFRTKEDLVGSYVEKRSLAWREFLTEQLDVSGMDPREKILLVFDLLGEWFSTDDFNGCPFINAEAESTNDSPAHAVNVTHRAWVRELFASLATQAGSTNPQPTAIRLAMLYDGAMVGAHTEPAIPWATEARNAAALVIR